jgi:hypothetical protein
VVLVVVGLSVAAAPLLVNGDFAEAQKAEASLPLGWTVPGGSGWVLTNEDGAVDQWSLRFSATAPVAGRAATQAVTLAANTTYILKAALKSDGQLRPLIRVLLGGAETARVDCPAQAAAGRWQGYSVTFLSGNGGQATVELWADARHAAGGTAPAGSASLDEVQIVAAAEQEAAAGGAAVPAYENVAKGCSYTLDPQPSYGYCTDANDKTQLTDGLYTSGYFWTQKSTVGWTHARPVVITLDLGADAPIRGLSYNTAAGVAGVEFPTSIMAMVSVDGRAFHALGDLVALSIPHGIPTSGKYAVHRFWTDALKAHGRYLKLFIDPAGAYCFVDEIEVFRGEDAWLDLPLPGKEIRYPMEYFQDNLFNAAVKRRIGYDLEAARAVVLGAGLEAGVLTALKQEIAAIEEGIGEIPQQDPGGFRSVFPLNDLHARVYALYGAVRKARGVPPLSVWGATPWDFLRPADLPEVLPAPALSIAAMRGETRAGALNVTNSTTELLRATLTFSGLPGGEPPADLSVHEVPWTDTYEGAAIAAALPVLAPAAGRYPISVPAGMTRQVCFSFRPVKTPAGTHGGDLRLAVDGLPPVVVPVSLRVFDLDFPVQPTLHVGGWDYTDTDNQYGVTPANREALIAHLREHYVDSPWATSAVMPSGSFGPDGQFTQPPATGRFDTWLQRWPDARRYCVFNAVGDSIAGAKIGTPEFAPRVVTWIRFWGQYLRDKGIRPDQLVLLLVDEPSSPEQDRVIVAWAQAIKAAEPGVVIWVDPIHKDPTEASPELMAAVDVLCPNRPMLLRGGRPFVDFYLGQKAAGRRLDLYSCSGPAFLLDPYTYHRLQAWSCFELGAESSFFWAFADTGGGSPWNAYTAERTAYAPAFVAPDSITAGKHMEAIRESVADFEYLTLLRTRIASLEKTNPNHARLPAARALLAAAPGRVLGAEKAADLGWREPKDRTVADTVRIEIGEMLEGMR